MFAALTLGELSGFRALNKPVLVMQTMFALDAALARYRAEHDAAAIGRLVGI